MSPYKNNNRNSFGRTEIWRSEFWERERGAKIIGLANPAIFCTTKQNPQILWLLFSGRHRGLPKLRNFLWSVLTICISELRLDKLQKSCFYVRWPENLKFQGPGNFKDFWGRGKTSLLITTNLQAGIRKCSTDTKEPKWPFVEESGLFLAQYAVNTQKILSPSTKKCYSFFQEASHFINNHLEEIRTDSQSLRSEFRGCGQPTKSFGCPRLTYLCLLHVSHRVGFDDAGTFLQY